MRDVHVDQIRDAVRQLCQDAATLLPDDVLQALKGARSAEESELGVIILDQILENADLAARERLPLCQDTGTTVIFLEVGQDVHIAGGAPLVALTEGLGARHTEGLLRASIGERPFSARTNTKNNTPPVVHTEIVPGDALRIKVMPKGGGCENMSRFPMFSPGAGNPAIPAFLLNNDTASAEISSPPVIVGVGI